ncbi:efflux RND transporter periplasmic adaptor subunit [Fodinibius halophilus]|uniref:Efflux RND transporter periplasmic adaptor subunit n=1 Tax=Fodinibius halophilus TaxID=1736908 RepID=A0A6M1SVT2_9BACT|nr:efflux RND transporter periplasmic adaptor subunit [Fodinibius halophilus]NGP87696.1 efflux RND transporter periplasmic adaptor subunit [Fodinibius halophilus]
MKSLNIKQTGKIVGILLAGFFLGWLFFGGTAGEKATSIDQHVEETHTDEEGNIVYTCSMHPQIRRNEPGDCPICGMELIPVDQADKQEETVFTMTDAAVKLAEIQTTTVERRIPKLEVRLPGRVAADERRVSSITAQFPGRIEDLYVDFTGIFVKKGEPLATIYSPELISAQQELLEAARNKQTNSGLYESTRRKLRLWGLPKSEIQRIESSGEVTDAIPIVATRSGYITKKNIDAKDYVNEGTVMYKIANFSTLWVLFDAYETDIGAIDQGDSVDFTVRSYPGKTFKAKITYVDPFINPQTRTARVRAEVDNTDGNLKPEMLARGIVSGTTDNQEKLVVPKSAVMWTGKRSIVFVKQPNSEVPTFEPRLVTLGHRAGNYYIIEEGVEEGEQVVTHGNFKLDSAAQLADKLSMMNRAPNNEINAPSNIKSDNKGAVDQNEVETNSPQTLATEQYSDINKEQVPDAFKKQLNKLVDSYLKIKNALTEDDLKRASSALKQLQNYHSNIDITMIEDQKQQEVWTTLHNIAEKHINTLRLTENITDFRDQFTLLSEALGKTFSVFGVNRTLYLQYCPMASKQEGGYWLSEEKKIVNPYMGKKMPGCGNTEAVI